MSMSNSIQVTQTTVCTMTCSLNKRNCH